MTGEFGRLARLAPFLAGAGEGVRVGVGDDAAVVDVGGTPVVVCVDAVVEGVHFLREVSSPADVGWKAMAVNVSDIAAMGAVPRAAVVALNRPPSLPEADVEACYRGMAEAAARWGVAVVGGDTVTAGEWSVAVTLLGEPVPGAAPVVRSGARVGDRVLLVGPVGAAGAAVARLEALVGDAGAGRAAGQVDPRHLAAHRRPVGLPACGQALARAGATAMIDVSDGVGADARHIAEASGVALRLARRAVASAVAPGVEAALGEGWLARALAGGEDFALLATVPAERAADAVAAVAAAVEAAGAAEAAPAGPVRAVDVGEVVAAAEGGPHVVLVDEGGAEEPIDRLGYDHG